MENVMHNTNHAKYLYIISLFLLATIAAYWAWNSLSELFNLPQVGYKHVLAAFILLGILKWGFFSNNQFNHAGLDHEKTNH